MNDEFVYVIQRGTGSIVNGTNQITETDCIREFLAEASEKDWGYWTGLGYKVVRLVVWE